MNFYDCKGGPGTTEPPCGACVTCLHHVIESKDAENAALQKRIRRLEEAGDRLFWMAPPGLKYSRVVNAKAAWTKAKEARP